MINVVRSESHLLFNFVSIEHWGFSIETTTSLFLGVVALTPKEDFYRVISASGFFRKLDFPLR